MTQLENYCTEIFVYIFRKLIISKNPVSFKLLELFGYHNLTKDDLLDIKIETQKKHSSQKRRIIPDIIICSKNRNIIIEVKVDSVLSEYNIAENKIIDQIELYKKIDSLKIDEVYLLSKYVLFSKALDNSDKILWCQIHEILLNSDNEVIDNFLFFLEENGMDSSRINKGSEEGFGAVSAILGLIENSWMYGDKYKLKEDFERGSWMGFTVNKKQAWIGQLKELKEYIVFQPLDDILKEKAEKIAIGKKFEMDKDQNDNYIFSKIKIEEIYQLKTPKDQRERFQKWINDEIKVLL